MSDRPTVELLYFDGCPNYQQLFPTIARLAAQYRLRPEVPHYRSDEGASPLPPEAWIRAALA